MTVADLCEELNKKGMCHGNCCGIIPIESKTLYRNRHLWQVKVIKQIPTSIGIFPETEDMHCVFLSRKTSRCMIYKDRPEVCHQYGTVKEIQCPYINMKGERRTKEEQETIEAIIDIDIENFKNDMVSKLLKKKNN